MPENGMGSLKKRMEKMMRRGLGWFRDFLRRETVLCAAVMLALISCIAVPPDREYVGYVDFRTLGILFSLMTVMAGLQKLGLFDRIAGGLLGKVKGIGKLQAILVMLCFFFSMLITNDVALITFVPFTFTVLGLAGEELKKKLAVKTVAMQTVAANLGSMLTPVGNPQNLYLYGKSGKGIGEFLALMLPYTLLSLGLIVIWCLGQRTGKKRKAGTGQQVKTEWTEAGQQAKQAETEWTEAGRQAKQAETGQQAKTGNRVLMAMYLTLFLLCILTVARILPFGITLTLVAVAALLADRRVLLKVDYGLLATFAGFFVFIGNIGRIPTFRNFLEEMVSGNEVLTAVLSSQVISNVPAALLLSGFTQDYEALIVGTNLGGLGTLIASMASLISFKYIGKEAGEAKLRYLVYFTAVNLIFLAVLLGYHYLPLMA